MEAIALIADIHVNLLAAEAVLSDIHKNTDLTALFPWATRSIWGRRLATRSGCFVPKT